jgi:hypothetical protein
MQLGPLAIFSPFVLCIFAYRQGDIKVAVNGLGQIAGAGSIDRKVEELARRQRREDAPTESAGLAKVACKSTGLERGG